MNNLQKHCQHSFREGQSFNPFCCLCGISRAEYLEGKKELTNKEIIKEFSKLILDLFGEKMLPLEVYENIRKSGGTGTAFFMANSNIKCRNLSNLIRLEDFLSETLSSQHQEIIEKIEKCDLSIIGNRGKAEIINLIKK